MVFYEFTIDYKQTLPLIFLFRFKTINENLHLRSKLSYFKDIK